MPDGQVLEFSRVTKRFGAVTAVSEFSARIEPGVVTGFLGPNGAGKTTSLRILLGLIGATEGTATIGGVPYAKLRHPLQSVGAVLEASSFHPGRTAANHLKVYAQAAGIAPSRVDETLMTVGLAEVGDRKVGGFSLGMRQRLGLAYALLGDPGVLVLDEPANGLDPEGIKWMRGLLRQLAQQGRTVLVSSHLLAEVQQTVDALLVISQGRLVFQGGLPELVDPTEYATVVDAPDRTALTRALESAGMDFEVLRSGLTVRGVDTVAVGEAAAAAGVALSTLQRRGPGLEEVFLDLVSGVRVHASAAGPGTVAGVVAAEPVAAEAVPAEEAAEEPAEDTAADAGAEPPEDEDTGVEEPARTEESTGPQKPDAAQHEARGFAVAATGVIEVIPATEADEPAEAPVEETTGEPEPDTEPEDSAADESGDRIWAMPAAEHTEETRTDEPVGVSEPVAVSEPAGVSEPVEDRTEADAEADRFFSSFDAHPEDAGDSEASTPPEPEPEPDSETGDEPEGGEDR